jgi:hypothetical protein
MTLTIIAFRRRLIDTVGARPSADHEWNATDWRWQLKPEVVAKEEERCHTILRITQLEQSRIRSLRELALGAAKAAERLKALGTEIAALRKSLTD